MVEASFCTFLITCPLCFLAGFIDSIAGGGGLICLPAFLSVGLPSHIAIGTNKVQSTIGILVSIIRYFRQGYVDIKIALACACTAILGSVIGSNIVLFVEDWTLKIALIILLPITAVFVLWNKGMQKKRKEFSFIKTIVIASIISFIIGTYDGFYGPGTGTFLILFLTTFGHMTLEKANGISKAANFASNITAAVIFLANGLAYIALGLTSGVFNAFGNFFGSKLFIDKGVIIIKPIMIVVLVLLFAKVYFDTFI